MLFLNFCKKVSPAGIKSKFVEKRIGKIKSQYPIGPPASLIVI